MEAEDDEDAEEEGEYDDDGEAATGIPRYRKVCMMARCSVRGSAATYCDVRSKKRCEVSYTS